MLDYSLERAMARPFVREDLIECRLCGRKTNGDGASLAIHCAHARIASPALPCPMVPVNQTAAEKGA